MPTHIDKKQQLCILYFIPWVNTENIHQPHLVYLLIFTLTSIEGIFVTLTLTGGGILRVTLLPSQ